MIFFRSAIYANRVYLELYKKNHSTRLAKNGNGLPKIIGNVFIHPAATVDPTATVKRSSKIMIIYSELN